jgi:hypothetical protein
VRRDVDICGVFQKLKFPLELARLFQSPSHPLLIEGLR